ncbi:GntR family transcriptional regulator [Vibrio algarum]|uniref:GntR family transcriptional regulator n=1 Tax=Vibrio algarum TaxID=3020714 RepID=A0ABT4YWV6_9VIBR|nr:GntR family transcriptional regulator [Vibrio sp. KJ40-1]MDB1125504.1 GntR family transcriptional regulator [Vibrio sp. KJ40-1]
MKLSDKAYDTLKMMILNNKFRINQRLLVDEAVELCGFSRTPVREALLRLQEDGLIKLHPRHGMEICALSKRDIEELYEIIAHLEVTAIELCIENTLEKLQLDQLKKYTEEMKVSLERNDIIRWADYDRQFHQAIFDYTENSRLIEVAKKYNEQNKRCKEIVIKLRPLPWESIEEHEKIIESIENRDADGARKLHLYHWKNISKQFVEFLDEYHFVDINN